MSNEQNPYNQHPQMQQGQHLPPPPLPNRRRASVPRPMLGQRSLLPDWLSKYAVITYVLALVAVSILYSNYMLPWYYMLSGVVTIMVFFIYGSNVAKRTSVLRMHSEKLFERRIFLVAFIPRVIWTLLIYYIFMQNYGDAFGFENADALAYDDLGQFVAGLIENGNFHFYDEISKFSGNDDIADMGYGVYVGFIYWLTSNSIIIVRILKCLLSAWTVLLIYRLTQRNFGEQTARVSAMFCALWPNFWYYCGTHLKEPEMVFLIVLFIEQSEQMFRSRQFTAWKVIPVLLLAAAMFTFRTILGIVALLALVFSIVMSSSKVVSWGKRIAIGALSILLIGVTAGNSIQERTSKLYEQVSSGEQQKNMEWRAKRTEGNVFARYAGTAVFAPMIFTLPFPSMVRPWDGQDLQQLLNGGNFIKNMLSFFTILSILLLLLSGQWREHMLPLAFILGYLIVIAFSTFAHSERFHQPVMPFEFMFTAYGLSVAVTKLKYKRWFAYWCGLMFVACLAWNWFKMAGRGLV